MKLAGERGPTDSAEPGHGGTRDKDQGQDAGRDVTETYVYRIHTMVQPGATAVSCRATNMSMTCF